MTARIALLGSLACLCGLAPGAQAAKVERNSVTGKSVKDHSLKGVDLRKGSVQVQNLNLPRLAAVLAERLPAPDLAGLQTRITGACADGEAMRAVAADGSVSCVPMLRPDLSGLQARVTGACQTGEAIRDVAADGGVGCVPILSELNLSGGIQALSGVPGRLNIGTDPAVLQRRVTGACQTGEALGGVAADGGVACVGVLSQLGLSEGLRLLSGVPGRLNLGIDPAIVQRRVSGTCGGTAAVRAVAADGTVTCTDDLARAGRVLSGFPSDVAVGAPDVTILAGPGGILLRGRCLASPARAEVYVTAPFNLNVVAQSRSLNQLQGGGPTVTLGSTQSFDRGDFDVGAQNDNTLHGQFYSYTNGSSCQFSAAGIASGTGATARSAGPGSHALFGAGA